MRLFLWGLLISGLSLPLVAEANEKKEGLSLINFWSPYCVPCGKEVGELNRLHDDLGAELKIVGVPAEGRKRDIQEFLKHFKPKFTQGLKKDYSEFKLQAVPTTILLGPEKKELKRWVGETTYQKILLTINKFKKGEKL